MTSFRGLFFTTQANDFDIKTQTNFLLMAVSVYRNRFSDFDDLFYSHKLSNKNRYLQYFTTALVGINLTTAQTAEIINKRSIFMLNLLATGMATSTTHFIIIKGTEEIRISSTSTNTRNLSRHFYVSLFSFTSRLDVKFCPVKFI